MEFVDEILWMMRRRAKWFRVPTFMVAASRNNHGYYYVSRQVSGNGAYMGQKLVIHEGTVKVL
jgi:hypothetical protein